MSMKNKEIQKEIIDLLSSKQECAFGDIVKQLDYSYNEVLNNVLEMKNKGEILKSKKHRGNYVIS